MQARPRLVMIQQIGRLVQQAITTITLSVTIMVFFPVADVAAMVAGVVPAFAWAKAILPSWDTPRIPADADAAAIWITCGFWVKQRSRQGG